MTDESIPSTVENPSPSLVEPIRVGPEFATFIKLYAGVTLYFGLLSLSWQVYAVSGAGSWETPGIELVTALPFLLSLASMPFSSLLLIGRRTRAIGLGSLAGVLVSLLITLAVIIIGHEIRMKGFELAASRASPLVTAINRYVEDHGAPPGALSDLVPRYLASIPEGLPPLEYEVVADDESGSYHENPWFLRAS